MHNQTHTQADMEVHMTCLYDKKKLYVCMIFGGDNDKEPACQSRRCRRHGFDPWARKTPLEENMTTHSTILAWRIPQTEEPGGLQSIGSQRVKHKWSNLACMHHCQTYNKWLNWLHICQVWKKEYVAHRKHAHKTYIKREITQHELD